MRDNLASQAALPEGEVDLRAKLIRTLTGHWLTDLGCSHEGAGSNRPTCWCGWQGERVENVGKAVAQWAAHASEEMRPHLAEALGQASGAAS